MLSHDSLKIGPNFVAPQIHQSHVASQTRLERNKISAKFVPEVQNSPSRRLHTLHQNLA